MAHQSGAGACSLELVGCEVWGGEPNTTVACLGAVEGQGSFCLSDVELS